MNDWAELSICNSPTGVVEVLQFTVIYMYDLYGSRTPLLLFKNRNRTMSLLAIWVLLVIGSKCHYLNTVGNPFGRI